MSFAHSVGFVSAIEADNERPIALPDKPLRIAIIAHCLYPIAQPYAGGLEMITQLICDELVAQGHEVLLYAHKDSRTQATLMSMPVSYTHLTLPTTPYV